MLFSIDANIITFRLRTYPERAVSGEEFASEVHLVNSDLMSLCAWITSVLQLRSQT